MASFNLLLLPGDGIGPEVMGEVSRRSSISCASRAWQNSRHETDLVGGSAYDAHKAAITDAAMATAQKADAVLFGAVGGPKWDKVPYEHRPEAGLLRLRKDLGLFANLRPAICYPALADASSLKRETGRGPRHRHRARTHRRRLFRRAEGNRHAGKRREARRRYAGLHHP